MQATELRIGNYFHYGDSEKLKDRLRNSDQQIIADDILFLSENSDVDYVMPIPLTVEWLMNFGFIWSEAKQVYMDLESGWFWLIEKDETYKLYYYGNSIGRQFQYVHELQNLYFSLTHSELVFKKRGV